MDAARRWQIVTVVTAVGGLGLGGLAVGNQPSEAIPTIELEPGPNASTPGAAPRTVEGSADPEIVSPEVRSLASPSAGDDDPPVGSRAATTGPTRPPATTTEPTAPAGGASADSTSTDSPDAGGSLDSDG